MAYIFLLSEKLFLFGMAHTMCWPVKTEEIVTKKDRGRCLERAVHGVRCSKEKVMGNAGGNTGVAADACLSTVSVPVTRTLHST